MQKRSESPAASNVSRIGNEALQRVMRRGFVGDIIGELRKVEWPGFQQVRKLCVIVIAISIGMGIMLGVVDFVFTYLVDKLFLGI